MADSRNTYTIKEEEGVGSVRVADEVVLIIAAMAATEVKGVASLAGGITNDNLPKKGAKSLSKCARISVEEGVVNVDLVISIEFDNAIPEVSCAVQERVKSAIEGMTGLKVGAVNISVTGVGAEIES